MDQVKAMKIFVRIYERSSFTLAADDLNLPRATLTHTLNQFEAWLGTRPVSLPRRGSLASATFRGPHEGGI